MNNSWYTCHLDMPDQFELCRIQQRKETDPETGKCFYVYYVITYYDGKDLFSGTREACRKWINDHWVERRYLDYYAN